MRWLGPHSPATWNTRLGEGRRIPTVGQVEYSRTGTLSYSNLGSLDRVPLCTGSVRTGKPVPSPGSGGSGQPWLGNSQAGRAASVSLRQHLLMENKESRFLCSRCLILKAGHSLQFLKTLPGPKKSHPWAGLGSGCQAPQAGGGHRGVRASRFGNRDVWRGSSAKHHG